MIVNMKIVNLKNVLWIIPNTYNIMTFFEHSIGLSENSTFVFSPRIPSFYYLLFTQVCHRWVGTVIILPAFCKFLWRIHSRSITHSKLINSLAVEVTAQPTKFFGIRRINANYQCICFIPKYFNTYWRFRCYGRKSAKIGLIILVISSVMLINTQWHFLVSGFVFCLLLCLTKCLTFVFICV